MLVLSRKLSQQILIGSDISITVVKIEGNHVRLGIERLGAFRSFEKSWSAVRTRLEVARDDRPSRQGVHAL